MDRPVILLAVIIVQMLVLRRDRLAGAIVGFLATTVALIWGIGVFGQDGQAVAFLFIPLSKPVFILLCVLWYVFDFISLIRALGARELSKAGTMIDDHSLLPEAPESLTGIGDPTEVPDSGDPIAALWHNDLKVRADAMERLVKKGNPEVVPRLMEALKSDRWDKRWTAAVTLGRLGDRRAVEALRLALHDNNALVKAVAADSLKALEALPPKQNENPL